MPKQPRGPQPLILLYFGLFILWGFGYETVWRYFVTEVDGVVVSSRDSPSKGAPRYSTHYLIRGDDGREQTYVAGATDGSLERSLPVGTRIRKKWGELNYEVDGTRLQFPWIGYSIMFGIALSCLFWAGLLWLRRP